MKKKRKNEKEKKEKEKGKTNLVGQLGDFLLESLHHIRQSLNLVANMGVNDTLGADGELVCAAVSVDLQVRMPLTTRDPRCCTSTSTFTSRCLGLVK